MEIKQYAKTITAATDLWANHKHGNYMMRNIKDKNSKLKKAAEVLLQMKPVLPNLME